MNNRTFPALSPWHELEVCGYARLGPRSNTLISVYYSPINDLEWCFSISSPEGEELSRGCKLPAKDIAQHIADGLALAYGYTLLSKSELPASNDDRVSMIKNLVSNFSDVDVAALEHWFAHDRFNEG